MTAGTGGIVERTAIFTYHIRMSTLSLQSLNMNTLYYFWVTARTGTISAAARELARSQPTLSLQLNQLERRLKTQLFRRTRAGVTLTSEGKNVFRHCQRIFSEADDLLTTINDRSRNPGPRLRLGISNSISRERLMPLEDLIYAMEPDITLVIHACSKEALKEKIFRYDVDLALSDEDFVVELGKDYISAPWDKAPAWFVASPDIKDRARPFPSCLSRIPSLLRTAACPTRKAVDMFFYEHGLSPVIRAESDDIGLLKLMACRGEGAVCLDSETLKEELGGKKLVKLHAGPVGIYEYAWLICNRHRGESGPLPSPAQRILDRLFTRLQKGGTRRTRLRKAARPRAGGRFLL